jgi:hypothetical protein
MQDFYLYDWFFKFDDQLSTVLAKRDDKTIKNIINLFSMGLIQEQ